MNKKLPNIYKENNYSHVNNNKKVYYSTLETNKKVEENIEPITKEEIVLNIPTVIETLDGIYNTKIVSKVGDHILTANNKVIKIKDIKKIKNIDM